MSSEMIAPDLPPYSLDVQSMDLGDDTKAVGLELLETESREPLRGPVYVSFGGENLTELAESSANVSWTATVTVNTTTVTEGLVNVTIYALDRAGNALVPITRQNITGSVISGTD